jgi:hypothetical protein
MRFSTIFVRLSMVMPLVLMAAGAPARSQEPGESYYMVIFSAQANSPDPRRTHCFATFVKATGTGESATDTEVHTISWMPRSLDIMILRRRPELGTNLDLQASLQWAQSKDSHVSMWGPYQIDKELYERAVAQKARLNSGQVLYKALDRRFRPGMASNCIHAVSDLDMENGLLHSGQGRGDEASFQVAQHLQRWVINPDRTHTWVASKLGLTEDSVSPPAPEQRSILASR